MLTDEQMNLLLSADNDIKMCNDMLFIAIKTAAANNDSEWLERLSYGLIENHIQADSLLKTYENIINDRDDIEKETFDKLSAYYAECRKLEDQLFAILKKRLSKAAPDLMKKALAEYGMAA